LSPLNFKVKMGKAPELLLSGMVAPALPSVHRLPVPDSR